MTEREDINPRGLQFKVFPAELKTRLHVEAARAGLSMQDAGATAIREWCERQEAARRGSVAADAG